MPIHFEFELRLINYHGYRKDKATCLKRLESTNRKNYRYISVSRANLKIKSMSSMARCEGLTITPLR